MGIIDDDLSVGNRGSDYINIGEALTELQNIDALMVSLLEQLGFEDTITYDTSDDVDLNDSSTWQDYLTKGRYTKKKRFWDYIFLQIINKGGVTNFVSPAEVTDAEVGARGNDYITKGELQKELLRTTAIIEFLSENADNIGDIDYNTLMNKPLINSIRLVGNKTSSDLGLVDKTDLDTKADITELTKETTARAEKDAELENKILTLQNKYTNLESKDTELETKISDEITNRENNYNELEGKIIAVNTNILSIENNIGDTTNLKTNSKIVVDAINELKEAGNTGNIGNIGIVYTAGNGVKINNDEISIDDTIVATKTDVTALETSYNELENEITNINTNITELQTKDTELEGKIIKEAAERNEGDINLQNKIDTLKKIWLYANGVEVKHNDLVLFDGKIYIANKDMTLDKWDVDEPNLILTDSDTVSAVTYEPDITIHKGQLVIYNKTLYLCDVTIDKTTTWDENENDMIPQQVEVDLTDYYTKSETNILLSNKEDLLTAGDGISIDKTSGNVIKVLSESEAVVNSIPKRDVEGQLKSKMPAVLENETVINNEKLTSEVNKLNTKDEEIENKITAEITNRETKYNELENTIVELKKQVDLLQGASVDLIYPVGSIYLSMDDNFLPSTAFGGVWEKIQTGRYLQATDTGAGTQVAESLPNIKGTQQTGSSKALLAHPSISVNSTSLIGTLSVGDNGKILYGTNGGSSAWAFLDFDASRVCSTYQNGAKVQPDSIKVVMWKRIS